MAGAEPAGGLEVIGGPIGPAPPAAPEVPEAEAAALAAALAAAPDFVPATPVPGELPLGDDAVDAEIGPAPAPATPSLPRRALGSIGAFIGRTARRIVDAIIRTLESVRLLRALLVILAVGVLAVGGGVAIDQLGPVTVRGSIVLTGGPFEPGIPCAGSGSLAPVAEGGLVEVRQAVSGDSAMAQGRIGAGTATSATECRLPFSIEGIRRGMDPYTIVVVDPVGDALGSAAELGERDLFAPVVIEIP